MTTTRDLQLLLLIALDITRSMPAQDRAQRLVDAVHRALPGDAVGVLRLDGEVLVPIASTGLSADLLGHRFRRSDHPRLDILCSAAGPTRFPADSPLPDPYDGFVDGIENLSHRVHSCLGCPLRIDDQLVGVLTLDSLQPDVFDDLDDDFLATLAALAAAALRTSTLIEALQRSARHQGIIVRDLVRDGLDRQGGLLIGNSTAMARLREEIDLVARSQFPVLVTGETGVGKELVVRTLHARSSRCDQPLVYVNCAALPESIAESELFGHARGAFTGAEAARLGKFQVADGACLFLDEIGELPLHIQPMLLRALQEGEIQSVGSDRPLRVDVRVFAATNRDLEAEVAAGSFRADLLYRLDVCRLRVPPLREHPEDVLMLAGHLCDQTRRELGTGVVRIDRSAQRALQMNPWPGNVRELKNVISRAVLRASARVAAGTAVVLGVSDLGLDGSPAAPAPTAVTPPPPSGVPFREAVNNYQRTVIKAAVAETGGNWAAAARRLGLQRSNLHHLAGRLGLR